MVGGRWVDGLTCLMFCGLLIGLKCIAGMSDFPFDMWINELHS